MNWTKIKKRRQPMSNYHNQLWLGFDVLIATLAILVIYLFFIANPSQQNQLKIGSTYMTMNNTFYSILNEQIANYVDNRNGRLDNRDPALNVAKQVEEIHFFINNHYNAIIINPVDGNSNRIQNALKLAKQHGLKIVIVDSQMKSAKYADCTILSDNYRAGQLCAQHLLKHKRHARILLLEHYSAFSANNRIQGFTDTIKHAKNHQNYQIINRLNTYGQSEITLPVVERALRHGPRFDTIMALNDQAAVGALAAIDEVRIKRPIAVYSVDGSENMKKLLGVNRNAIATAAQTPINLGKKAAQATYKLITGKPVPAKIILPVHLITNQNINRFNVLGWQ